jgi:hypothetical protein
MGVVLKLRTPAYIVSLRLSSCNAARSCLAKHSTEVMRIRSSKRRYNRSSWNSTA